MSDSQPLHQFGDQELRQIIQCLRAQLTLREPAMFEEKQRAVDRLVRQNAERDRAGRPKARRHPEENFVRASAASEFHAFRHGHVELAGVMVPIAKVPLETAEWPAQQGVVAMKHRVRKPHPHQWTGPGRRRPRYFRMIGSGSPAYQRSMSSHAPAMSRSAYPAFLSSGRASAMNCIQPPSAISVSGTCARRAVTIANDRIVCPSARR